MGLRALKETADVMTHALTITLQSFFPWVGFLTLAMVRFWQIHVDSVW